VPNESHTGQKIVMFAKNIAHVLVVSDEDKAMFTGDALCYSATL
jgi:hypothetical protein